MNQQTSIVLGIDPGLDRTGWAVLCKGEGPGLILQACGLIHTAAEQALPQRLHYIYKQLTAILAQYQPNQVAMEQNFFLKRASTMASTVMTRGVILLACEQAGRPITFYSPKQVKMVVCGTGTADKKQVQRMVQLTLHLNRPPEPDDVADAVAMAICHYKTAPLAQKMNLQKTFLAKLKEAQAQQLKNRKR